MSCRSLLAICGLFLIGAVFAGGCAIPRYVADEFVPVFSMEQVASQHSDYRHSTLSAGGTVYVHDYEEYPLLVNADTTQVIGKMGLGGSKIYAIPGQTGYLALTDSMWQEVYRDVKQPPFDWRTAEFQKLRLAIPTGPAANKETTDPHIIGDVLTTLKEGTSITVPLQPNGNYEGYNNYAVLLFSDQLPGLVYSAGLHIDSTGQVYLAVDAVSKEWYPASLLFSQWMTGN